MILCHKANRGQGKRQLTLFGQQYILCISKYCGPMCGNKRHGATLERVVRPESRAGYRVCVSLWILLPPYVPFLIRKFPETVRKEAFPHESIWPYDGLSHNACAH